MSQEYCYDCGGELKVEIAGIYHDLVCQDCGLIVDSEEVVEDQESIEATEDEYAVME